MQKQPVYRYNANTHTLDEQPSMEKPDQDIYMPGENFTKKQQGDYWKAEYRYREHLASLRLFPTDFRDWPDRDLVEGVDFEIVKVCCRDHSMNYRSCLRACEEGATSIAVVLLKPEQEEDQDALWREVGRNSGGMNFHDIEVLKKNFILKRK